MSMQAAHLLHRVISSSGATASTTKLRCSSPRQIVLLRRRGRVAPYTQTAHCQHERYIHPHHMSHYALQMSTNTRERDTQIDRPTHTHTHLSVSYVCLLSLFLSLSHTHTHTHTSVNNRLHLLQLFTKRFLLGLAQPQLQDICRVTDKSSTNLHPLSAVQRPIAAEPLPQELQTQQTNRQTNNDERGAKHSRPVAASL